MRFDRDRKVECLAGLHTTRVVIGTIERVDGDYVVVNTTTGQRRFHKSRVRPMSTQPPTMDTFMLGDG